MVTGRLVRNSASKSAGKKRAGEESEGECPSETDSLGSLSKRARGLFIYFKESAAWGMRP